MCYYFDTISLSCHEQVCSWHVLNILVHDMINLLYYEYWTDKQKYLYVYYFDDLIYDSKIDFNIFIIKKLYENISVYNISYKRPTGPKPSSIRFNKTDRFIISLGGKIKHLVLFDYGLPDKICDKIEYLRSKKVVL